MIKCENFDTLSLNIKNYYDEDANRKPIKKCKKIKNVNISSCLNLKTYTNMPNLKSLYLSNCKNIKINNKKIDKLYFI